MYVVLLCMHMCCWDTDKVALQSFASRDVVVGDLETAEARLDDAYAASDKEKKLRYVCVCYLYALLAHLYCLHII